MGEAPRWRRSGPVPGCGGQRVHQNLRTSFLKVVVHVVEANGLERRDHGWLVRLLAVEHQEPASARSGELAATGAVLQGQLVQLVDPWCRDAGRQALLLFPRLPENLAEALQVASFEAIARLVGSPRDRAQ